MPPQQPQSRLDGLDVLVNNAGISGDLKLIRELTAADIQHVYDTNVLDPLRGTPAFIPLVQRSEAPVIVNVSSGFGSETLIRDPERVESTVVSVPYCSSKAALNMITSQYVKAYPDIRIEHGRPRLHPH